MYKTGQRCVVCGEGKLTQKIVTEKFKYKGKENTISDYCVYECNKCEDVLVDSKTIRSTEKILTDFRREIDGLLTSSEIVQIRKKLGKTQKEMAELLEAGEKNFARYETGQVTQGRSTDLLLRVLDKDPYALDSIKHRDKKVEYQKINGKGEINLHQAGYEKYVWPTQTEYEEYDCAA